MRREQLAEVLRARRFKPVKLHIYASTVDPRRDLCLLLQWSAVVGVPESDDFVIIDLAQVSHITNGG
jgi:hypothetical protein